MNTAVSLPSDAMSYLKESGIPELMETIFHEITVHAPEDPIEFLIDWLNKSEHQTERSFYSGITKNISRLLSPAKLASLAPLVLQNHLVMAPMTRSRANTQGILSDLSVEYYQQRAGVGLIITEGTQMSYASQGYARTPGIHTQEHVAAWKKITSAVHMRGAKIFIQLMHAGRIAHPLNRQIPDVPVAPSAVKATVSMWTDASGMQEVPTPRELTLQDIQEVIQEYASATTMAMSAGFDGVELHCASGYLPHQFLSSNANKRSDLYGGSLENRCRFIIETLNSIIHAAGSSGKVGIKISPMMGYNDVIEDDPEAIYGCLLREVTPLNLAYVHVLRSSKTDAISLARKAYKGTIIGGGGYTAETSVEALESSQINLVAFGSLMVSNPDLPERFKRGAALTVADPSTFFTPGPRGYTDYPFLPSN